MTPDRSVVVLGRRCLLRDVVTALLQTTGYRVLGAAAATDVPTVLVNPGNQDWERVVSGGRGAVVVASKHPTTDELLELVQRGADAVVDANDAPGVLVQAVEAVAAGDPCLSASQTRAVLARLRDEDSTAARALVLTPRERDILASIALGESVKQTARRLDISEKTVQNTQGRLFRKLQARNRAQAIARAHEFGIL